MRCWAMWRLLRSPLTLRPEPRIPTPTPTQVTEADKDGRAAEPSIHKSSVAAAAAKAVADHGGDPQQQAMAAGHAMIHHARGTPEEAAAAAADAATAAGADAKEVSPLEASLPTLTLRSMRGALCGREGGRGSSGCRWWEQGGRGPQSRPRRDASWSRPGQRRRARDSR